MRRLASGIRIGTAAWLVTFAGVALALRIGISYDAVFGHDFVRFIENDAWYHMRLVDATLRHFPQRLWFDPYLVHPGGEPVNAGPFLDWVIAGVALLLGLGAPSSHLVDVVGAYTPAVMGALFCVPIYVLGRELFSRRAGLWAAFIIGVLPGQTLIRSLVGFTDHHCAEALLSTTSLMWIVLALDSSRPLRRRLWLSALGGAALGCYLLTWSGGSVFVMVVVASTTASLVFQRLRREPADNLPLILAPAFVLAAAMIGPWVGTRPFFGYDVAALVGGLLLLIALRAWGRATASHRHGLALYLTGLAVSAALCLLVAYIGQGGRSGLVREIGRLWPQERTVFVREALPLLRSEARYPLPLWNEFVACLFLAILGGVAFLVRPRAVTSAKGALLAVWTGVMIAATLAQVRFTYYLGMNVALLAGFACDELLRRGGPLARRATGLAILLLVTLPAAARIEAVRGSEYALSDDWYDALQWLRSNTAEPFGTDEAYYRTDFTISQAGASHASAYGVLAWWNYGYWIVRVAHRVPNTNPKQTRVKEVASFLLAENPAEASTALDALGSRYVVVDVWLQARLIGRRKEQDGLFPNVALAAERTPSDYCQEFELEDDGSRSRMRLYCFPNYYRTMAVRLYAFAGRAVVPGSVMAVSWTDQERGGSRVRRLVREVTFGTYDAAVRFIAERPSEQWRIASPDPLTSCVPLEALPDYRQVFQSLRQQPTTGGRLGPALVQIYERSARPASQRQTQ
jgi:oligosaccharyl transferase (archaeosortase A-associated)